MVSCRNNMIRGGIFLLLIAYSYASCEKEGNAPIVPSNYPYDNYKDVFTAFWNGMNTRYVFWDWDSTNWDQVYSTYQPKFAELDTARAFNGLNKDSVAYQYLKAMTSTLIDGHYQIEGLRISGHTYSINPSYNRKRNDPAFLANGEMYTPYFDSVLVGRLQPSHVSVDTIYDGDTVLAVSGVIDQKILYLYFKSFHLGRFYGKVPSLTAALDFFRGRLRPDSSQYEGAIIDVRGNYGGEISDFDLLLGNLLDAPLPYGYTRTKSGNGRLDYTPWIPAIINPAAGGGRPLSGSQQIVVLADNWSQSAAEQLTMAIKRLPNSTFVGYTTWGANGPFIGSAFYSDFFGGSFNFGITGNGIASTNAYGFVKTSSSMFKYINDTSYEGNGFPPDILVLRDTQDIRNGVDVQLDKAISLFK